MPQMASAAIGKNAHEHMGRIVPQEDISRPVSPVPVC